MMQLRRRRLWTLRGDSHAVQRHALAGSEVLLMSRGDLDPVAGPGVLQRVVERWEGATDRVEQITPLLPSPTNVDDRSVHGRKCYRIAALFAILLLAAPVAAQNIGGTVEIKLRSAPVLNPPPAPVTNFKITGRAQVQLAAYTGGATCSSLEARAAAWQRYAQRFGLIVPVAFTQDACQVAGVRHVSQEQAIETAVRFVPNNIPNAGEAWLVGLVITNNLMKFHGLGTSTTAVAETDTGCLAEVNSVYSTPNVRATGSLTTGTSTSQLLSAATTQLTATRTLGEFCLLNQAAAPGGTVFTRTTFAGLVVTSANFVDSTYRLTVE